MAAFASRLIKPPAHLHCLHEDTPRSPGDDATECHFVPASFTAALYLRAALPANAGRCAALESDVLGGHAETWQRARDTFAGRRTGINSSFRRAPRWHVSPDFARTCQSG